MVETPWLPSSTSSKSSWGARSTTSKALVPPLPAAGAFQGFLASPFAWTGCFFHFPSDFTSGFMREADGSPPAQSQTHSYYFNFLFGGISGDDTIPGVLQDAGENSRTSKYFPGGKRRVEAALVYHHPRLQEVFLEGNWILPTPSLASCGPRPPAPQLSPGANGDRVVTAGWLPGQEEDGGSEAGKASPGQATSGQQRWCGDDRG